MKPERQPTDHRSAPRPDAATDPNADVDRGAVLRGGLLGLGIGLACLALALFFLVRGFDTPDEVFGVFVPLAVALLPLGLATIALVPLAGNDERTPGRIALLLRLEAGLGVALAAAAAVRSASPYAVGIVLPALAAYALLRSASRLSRPAAAEADAGA